MPNEVQQLVADEFMRKHIEPYYIGNILKLDLKRIRTATHTYAPSISSTNKDGEYVISCSRRGGCQVEQTLNPQKIRLGKEKLTRSMFHAWNFATAHKKYRNQNLGYVIEDEESNLIFGHTKDKKVFTLGPGSLVNNTRNLLIGKLELFQVCQLYQSQIGYNLLSHGEKCAIGKLKQIIRTLCTDKQEETKKNE